MSFTRLGAAFAVAVLCLSIAPAGCGSGGDEAKPDLKPAELAQAVERQATEFLNRKGTALHRSLQEFLGGKITAKVAQGSTECRPGNDTASIDNPNEFPFACIVGGSADGKGLEVNITLGFVGLELDGRCWKAANERVSVTTGAPALLTREEAMRPVNQISGCPS